MKPTVNIQFFEGSLKHDDNITAYAENTNKFSQEPYTEHTINVEEFKEYATGEELFDFCTDFPDASKLDGHGQRTGKLTWEQYCDLKPQAICEDLSQFLSHKNSKSNGTKLHRRTGRFAHANPVPGI